MAIEIRPVTRAEPKEYLRALPFVSGLPQEEPEPSAWYAGASRLDALLRQDRAPHNAVGF